MCGIFGAVSLKRATPELVQVTRSALNLLRHRGPDDEGVHVNEALGVVFGHRRLSIIDPENGRQPMHTEDGEITIVFNGAIYNYLELRRDLISRGHRIHSYSDTEVILYAYREWGDACVGRFLGMFAFAILDRPQRRIFCARDRVGIKPFYYHFDGHTLLFSSEIKAIIGSGAITPTANAEAIQDYLTFQFCLGEKTLFKDIKKLEPGHTLAVQLGEHGPTIQKRAYWDLQFDIDDTHNEQWFVDHLAGLIEDATRLHLRSDVPLGAHLSGGLDSSAVVCLAANLLRGERIKTFTGAFPDGPEYDETRYAKLVSTAADTEYHDVYIHGNDLPSLFPKLMYFMDEPVAGPGLIPQDHVSTLAARHVKVVLGGQGGDELFIGYARYLVAYLEKCLSGAIFETAHQLPYAVTLESIVPNLPILRSYAPMLQSLWSDGLFGEADQRYFKLVDRSEGTAKMLNQEFLKTAYSPFESFAKIFNRPGLHSLINQMTYFDLKGSLPALLHVEDRTSMAASIESRVPLLDHRIVEFMASIPPNIKFAGGRMKHLFKESVRNTVPSQIFDRKDKMGFPTPLNKWTKGSAKEFVEDILLSERTIQRGLFDRQAIKSALKNEREFGRSIWGLMCLEQWHRTFIDGEWRSHG